MSNQILDIFIFLIVKILLVIGFIAGIKYWIKKNKSIKTIPIIAYWILGLFFVFMLSSHVFEAVLISIPVDENNAVLDKKFLGSSGYLLGFIFYILIGVKYLQR